nr:unnamed protein product [Callosobruchus chinensis]
MLNFYVYILAMRYRKISLYSKFCAAFGLQQFNQNVVKKVEHLVITCLSLSVLKNAFDTFDVEKKGSIGTVMIGTILSMLGVQTTEQMLADIINEVDEDGSGELEFEEFVTLASRFMVEEDAEAMQQELKEAFRLYDKEGNGYITTSTLKEILKELDDKLTSDELDMMIQEIDTDEFMEVMTVYDIKETLIRTGSGSSHRLNISHKMLGYFKPSLFYMYIYATPL